MLQNKLMYVEIDASAVFHKICCIKCSWHFYMKFIISSISKKSKYFTAKYTAPLWWQSVSLMLHCRTRHGRICMLQEKLHICHCINVTQLHTTPSVSPVIKSAIGLVSHDTV